MSPWWQQQQGKKRDLVEKPILKYFTESEDKKFWICQISMDDEDNTNICGAQISAAVNNKENNTNLGNS